MVGQQSEGSHGTRQIGPARPPSSFRALILAGFLPICSVKKKPHPVIPGGRIADQSGREPAPVDQRQKVPFVRSRLSSETAGGCPEGSVRNASLSIPLCPPATLPSSCSGPTCFESIRTGSGAGDLSQYYMQQFAIVSAKLGREKSTHSTTSPACAGTDRHAGDFGREGKGVVDGDVACKLQLCQGAQTLEANVSRSRREVPQASRLQGRWFDGLAKTLWDVMQSGPCGCGVLSLAVWATQHAGRPWRFVDGSETQSSVVAPSVFQALSHGSTYRIQLASPPASFGGRDQSSPLGPSPRFLPLPVPNNQRVGRAPAVPSK